MIHLALAAALLFQQQVPRQRAPIGSGDNPVQTASKQAITDLGLSIAETRSAHEDLRRAVFNMTDTMVVQRMHDLRERCQALTTLSRATSGKICRTCFAATAQRAVEGYRAILPVVTRVGTRCTSQLGGFLATRSPAASVRRDIWAVGRNIVAGLYPYEARLRVLRRAFGLEAPSPTPRR